MTLADAGLSLRAPDIGGASLESDSGIISPRAAAAARRTIAPPEQSTPVFAYLAHTLRVGAREIPYAVVAGIELDRLDPAGAGASGPIKDDRIWLNAWAAEGLQAKVGDTVTLGYDVWDDAGAMASPRDDADRRRHPADVRRRRGSDADAGVPGHLGSGRRSPTGIRRSRWT